MAERVVCLAGATGTGKTEAAIRLCERFQGAVVNYDSRQVYKGLAQVTAQPSVEERERCPHLLYGFLDVAEPMTAGRFSRLAREIIGRSTVCGSLPLLVGGTGLYLKAILTGLAEVAPIPGEIRIQVLADMERLGPVALHGRLKELDPAFAAKIHPNDRQRISRGIEVALATGRPLSWWHEQQDREPKYRALTIGLGMDLEALTPRLARRIEIMVEAGAVEEVRQAFERHPDPKAPGFSGIGCQEIIAHLQGRLSLEEAKGLWLKNTRSYAKRQMTWFKSDPGTVWVEPDDFAGMAGLVERFLASA